MGPGLRREADGELPSLLRSTILRDTDEKERQAGRWTGQDGDDSLLCLGVGKREEMP